MRYLFFCPKCNEEVEIECSMAERDHVHSHHCGTMMTKVFVPTMHVGIKVKPKSKDFKARREYLQQKEIDRKRAKGEIK